MYRPMLTRLQITNFKAWQDTRPVRLAPLTVLFGSNSSGKSSINQFLLMLKQTVESADRKRVFHTGDEATPVDLGTFRDLIFRHETDRHVAFSFEFDLPRDMRIQDPATKEAYSGSRLAFSADVAEVDGRQPQLKVMGMRYELLSENSRVLTIGMEPDARRPTKYDLIADPYKPVRTRGRPWELPAPLRFYGFPDEALFYYQNTTFTSDLALALENVLRGISYLGPLRDLPRRLYTWPGDTPEHVGFRGERAIDAILAAGDRRISPGYRRTTRPFQEIVARWLRDLGLIEAFDVRPLSEYSKANEVWVRTTGSAEEVLLTDVGFGVSQVLPVVIQCFYAPPHSTVILEQPEIHLHPAVQSNLADLFIEAVDSRENGEDRNLQLIVESHSEHFLRRLMRRIAEDKIDPARVALYFCEPSLDGSKIHELDVDVFGNIRNWPPDFFGDQMEDIALQAEAGLRRRIEDGLSEK
jgi:predicted ATPase